MEAEGCEHVELRTKRAVTTERQAFMANEKNERNEKIRAIEAALAQIEKAFGKGAIMRLGEHRVDDIPVISTSSIGIDAAIGIGGVPRGRVIESSDPKAQVRQRSRFI